MIYWYCIWYVADMSTPMGYTLLVSYHCLGWSVLAQVCDVAVRMHLRASLNAVRVVLHRSWPRIRGCAAGGHLLT
jgi:hypothetical protein